MNQMEGFLLSLFNRTDGLKPAQVFHVLNAKRTGSTFYQALTNHLLPYFGLIPALNRKNFDRWMEQLIQEGYLSLAEREDHWRLNPNKREELNHFFESYPYPKYIHQLHYGYFDHDFWLKLQFISQVLSEMMHHNRNYQPFSTSPRQQFWVKRWLAKHGREGVGQDLAAEWTNVFTQLEDERANFLARQLTGHQRVGQTVKQLTTDGQSPYLRQKDALHQLMAVVDEQAKDFPLFSSIYQASSKVHLLGLSPTAFKTKRFLEKRMNVHQIAQIRGVKIGTIADHLMEIAVVVGMEDVNYLYDSQDRKMVNDFLDHQPPVYKIFNDYHPHVPFYKYRLIEIERFLSHELDT